MREYGHNVIDLNAMRTKRFAVAPHPTMQTIRMQLNRMTEKLTKRTDELVRDLRQAAANGEASDPEAVARVARQLDETRAQMRAKIAALPQGCIPFPRARTGSFETNER